MEERDRPSKLTRKPRPDLAVACLVFAVCLAVYIATLSPGLSFVSPDSNELITQSYTLGLAHFTGYPLYTWIGKLFTFIPVGDAAYRVNLMSATLGAAGVALFYLVLLLLTSHRGSVTASRLASGSTALFFAFSATFWSQTGIAEVYAPNVLLFALSLLLLLLWARGAQQGARKEQDPAPHGDRVSLVTSPSRRPLRLLFLFSLCLGLSLGTHLSNLGLAPVAVLFVLVVDRRAVLDPRALIAAPSGFILGLSQFLWLPFRAHTLIDRWMLDSNPTTLQGVYKYTLGAYPYIKFAFPLAEIPGRIVFYFGLLLEQFGIGGIAAGVVGLGVMLVQRPKHACLLLGNYLVQVWFYVQADTSDVEVMFIPSHLVFALFIGFGLFWLLERLFRLVERWSSRRGVVTALLLPVLALPAVYQLEANREACDYSEDFSIGDFYRNVFELLPEGGALLGRIGVLGYDMIYYRRVLDLRPDVVIPHAFTTDPKPEQIAGRALFTTIRFDDPVETQGPWAPPASLTPPDVWFVPVLFSPYTQPESSPFYQPLSLYRVSRSPPELVVKDASPPIEVDREAAGLVLVGADVASREVKAGKSLTLTLYWRPARPRKDLLLGTLLDGEVLETHELGMGNLPRYVEAFSPPEDGVVVEAYKVVVPRVTEAGDRTLSMGIGFSGSHQDRRGEWEAVLDLAGITITPGG